MKTRIISAVIGIAVLVAAVAAAITLTPVILQVLLAVIGVLGVYEALIPTGYVKSKFIAAVCFVYAAGMPFVYTYGGNAVSHEAIMTALAVIVFAAGMFCHKTVAPTETAYAFAMTVAITYSFWAVSSLFCWPDDHGLFYLSLMLLGAWGCDTGAYFTGHFFGKHKMAPEISPKKTVEGAVGGIVSTVVLMVAACLIFDKITGNRANIPVVAAAAPVLAFSGMMGDLIASYIKRAAGIKDYGKIMPGHGGVLDRFDSVITVVPLVHVLVTHFDIVL